MIPFWNPTAQYLKHKDELDAAINDVLMSGNWVLGAGEYVEKFEKEFAELIGVKHAIMVRNGTSALYLSYKVLGIGPGDEVIVPSNTFIATIDQVVANGAKPVLVDCDENGLIDPREVQNAIKGRTKAIVPVHMEGKVCDMYQIGAGAHWSNGIDAHSIPVIEDAAQAIGADAGVYDGMKPGNPMMKAGSVGSVGCFSFFPAKILGSFGNAGAITTNDDVLAERLRMLRCNSNIGKNPNPDAELGMNMEPDNRDAAWLSVKLKYLPENLARRKAIAERYLEELKDVPITLPWNQSGRVWQDFMILSGGRTGLQMYLKDQGIEALVPNPRIPNHRYSVFSGISLPKTEEYVAKKLALPCNDTITDDEVGAVIKAIKDFYEK